MIGTANGFRHSGSLVAFLLALGMWGGTSAQQPPGPAEERKEVDDLEPVLTLGKLPAVEFKPRTPLSAEQTTRIKKCIAQLAEIEKPDFGLSATMSGQAFLPVPSQRHSLAMLWTDHDLRSSDALRTLVEIGPDALPFLLAALGDKTPTKLEFDHSGGFGGMWFARELSGNPVNELERKTLEAGPGQEAPDEGKHVEKYTVNVGDVCFVAIGQIVGRPYRAVRYQPSGNIVLNSPTHDDTLRDQVRRIWSSDEPVRKLFDSLLLDYATDARFNGSSLDGWDFGSELRIQAAVRLLYYFPRETAGMIAQKLGQLDVRKTSERGHGSPATPAELDAYIHREVANGIRTDDFIAAISWSREPVVAEAIQAIFRKTDEIDSLLAALPGIEDRKLIRDRLEAFLAALPEEEGGLYGDGYNLLIALAERLGPDAVPAFDKYLRNAVPQRGQTAAEALKTLRGEWCVPVLLRLLDDSRPTPGYTFVVDERNPDRELPTRVCDVAAEALQVQHPELQFVLEGEYAEVDRKIQAIRDKLGPSLKR